MQEVYNGALISIHFVIHNAASPDTQSNGRHKSRLHIEYLILTDNIIGLFGTILTKVSTNHFGRF